jgi:outer membrane protein
MKKSIFLVIVSILYGFSAQAAELKIGYVDLNKALNESNKGESAVKLLEEMVKAKQTFINGKEEEIKKLDTEIAKQTSILTQDALKGKQEKREKLMRDYQRMVKDSQEEIQKKRNEFMEGIIKDLRKTVVNIGKKEGYSIIFEKIASGILYIPEEVDLTDELIKLFNNESKKD